MWRVTVTGVSTDLNVNTVKYTGGSIATPSLTIKDTGSVDQGYYVCSANNVVGTGQSGQTYLTVSGSEFCLLYWFLDL